ncbi:MAG: hypothetical protein MSS42_07140 [Bacteroidales bacterium]|nr:hypothetical protein [Bacteroidales bacterium]
MILQLWADVKYHVPTGFGFSPKASGFYPFGDATALAGEGGVGDVVWLIQASASNHKPKEPSLWFAGFFQSLLNNHRGNLYIISQKNRDCQMMRQSRFSSI